MGKARYRAPAARHVCAPAIGRTSHARNARPRRIVERPAARHAQPAIGVRARRRDTHVIRTAYARGFGVRVAAAVCEHRARTDDQRGRAVVARRKVGCCQYYGTGNLKHAMDAPGNSELTVTKYSTTSNAIVAT